MIGTLQSSNFFALKESPLRAVNVVSEMQSIGEAFSQIGYGFAAPGAQEAAFVGLFGPYVVTPLQLDLPGSELYTWELDPPGQDLLGLSMSSSGLVSGDITSNIDHIYDPEYLKPSVDELPPNGSLYGFSPGINGFPDELVIHLRVRASGGPLAGRYEALCRVFLYFFS